MFFHVGYCPSHDSMLECGGQPWWPATDAGNTIMDFTVWQPTGAAGDNSQILSQAFRWDKKSHPLLHRPKENEEEYTDIACVGQLPKRVWSFFIIYIKSTSFRLEQLAFPSLRGKNSLCAHIFTQTTAHDCDLVFSALTCYAECELGKQHWFHLFLFWKSVPIILLQRGEVKLGSECYENISSPNCHHFLKETRFTGSSPWHAYLLGLSRSWLEVQQ